MGKKQEVCSIMLNAALKHKEHFKKQQELAENAENKTNTDTAGAPDEPTPMIQEESEEDIAKRQKKIEECNKVLQHVSELAIIKINNPEDLLSSAKAMSQRQEYRLALK